LGQEGDDITSLPAPPPPNPAARRSAIDTALRKFDSVEDAPRAKIRRTGIFGWASSHRRATGGLVTAALIALVGIPAMQIALRNQPNEVASERAAPGLATADVEAVQDNAVTEIAEPRSDRQATATVPIARNEPVAAPEETGPVLAKDEQKLGFTASEPSQKARVAKVAPMISTPALPGAAAAPPPPPPPPVPAPPMAEREAADAVASESGNIVVTGQKARRQNMASPAPATAVTAEDASADFQDELQSAFRTGNRKAILGLIGFPLKVDFNGDTRTYRSRSDVERDFDRIFTSDVRESVLSGQPTRHLSFAPSPPDSTVKIRAVRP
jgi:hypothetical protein